MGLGCQFALAWEMKCDWPLVHYSLRGVVEDDTRGVASTGKDSAHSVPHVYSVDSPCAADGAVVDGKDYGVALAKGDDNGAGLHAGALFGHYKFAAGEVAARFGQEQSKLQREDVVAVEVLMEAVVIAGLVLE